METRVPITVLMPAYNAGPYICQAIDSVLAQSYGDFELLIINDGSTDNTEELINGYSDGRIRLYTQENKGVIEALNYGLQLARGRYIARFDADDVCYPDRLKIQYDYMQQHPACVLLGAASDYIDKDGNYLFEWQPPAYDTAGLKQKILEISPFDHPTIMYRLDVALKIGGYPKGAIHFEDHIFWTHFFEYGEVRNLDKPLIKHRFNPGSVTIDEKWRGERFMKIKYRSVKSGVVSDEDAAELKEIIKHQDIKKYKEAAYYSMIGKKYLWNRHDPVKARAHFKQAISIMPQKAEPYMLYLFSFMPQKLVEAVYNRSKK